CHMGTNQALVRRTGSPGAVCVDSSAPSDANHTVASARRAKRDTSGISEPRNQSNDARRPTRPSRVDRAQDLLLDLCAFQLTGRVGISKTKTDPPPGRGS